MRRKKDVDVQIVYKGPALKSGRMDVKDFCNSILGFDGLIREAARLLDPDAPSPVVKIGKTKKVGADGFGVSLHLYEGSVPTNPPSPESVTEDRLK